MSSLLAYLKEKIGAEMEVVQARLVDGRPTDYAAYKHDCGIYRGLLIANNLVTETADRMREDDDPE